MTRAQLFSLTAAICALLSFSGPLAAGRDRLIFAAQTETKPEARNRYMGGEFDRGLFDYGYYFYGDGDYNDVSGFWNALLKIGPEGRILDAGSGNSALARDLYSTSFDAEQQLTTGFANLHYWPGKAPEKGFRNHELSEEDYQGSKEMFDFYKGALNSVRQRPPEYVGITSRHLDDDLVGKNQDVFANRRVKVFTEKLFSDLSNEELLAGGNKFDLIVDMFGVFTYSPTLQADVQKMFSLLRIGGKLFVATEPNSRYASDDDHSEIVMVTYGVIVTDEEGQLKTWSDWFRLASGVQVIASFDGPRSSGFVVEKTSEEVVLPNLELGTVSLSRRGDVRAFRMGSQQTACTARSLSCSSARTEPGGN